ncbi:galactonate dehydratase [Georgenia deserti]|uniref:Galactonate dehydratase n=1 Tax=Georgenia deserti TaxID=2093781 RepID=A0ABW4L6I3_9MICO
MKITRLEVVHVAPKYSFLKVHTSDEHIVGIGEACLEGKARVVEVALREFSDYLIGQDPRRIEKIWHELYRGTFYPSGSILASAMSAVDQALWDILGKHHDAPVHALLGGAVRERIRLYQHVQVEDHGPFTLDQGDRHIELLTQRARQAAADGFTMIKTALPGPARQIESRAYVRWQGERFRALREAVGDDVDIAIDFHGRATPDVALAVIQQIAEYQPMFVEEPCLPENVPAMARIAEKSPVPIATGERLFTRWQFRDVLERGAASVLQPDLAHCGGISEGRKIAALGETYYAGFAPHNPLGPVNLAASVHLTATVPSFVAQEQQFLGEGVVATPFEVRDGYVELPTGPGLGMELLDRPQDEPEFDGGWTLPTWRDHTDGGLLPW